MYKLTTHENTIEAKRHRLVEGIRLQKAMIECFRAAGNSSKSTLKMTDFVNMHCRIYI